MSDQPYDNTNRGVLFRNKRKRDEKSAEYTGQGNVNGVECWIDAWVAEKNGEKYFRIRFKPRGEQQEQNPATETPTENEVPF